MYKDNIDIPLWEQAEARLNSSEQEFEPSSVISQDEAINLQMLRPDAQQPSMDTGMSEHREYEKLSVPQTLGDIGKSMGAEALRVFAPEQGSKASQFLGGYSEDNLWQYKPKTRVAEGIKSLQHVLGGTLAIMATAELTGGATAYVGAAKNLQGWVQFGDFLRKSLGSTAVMQNIGKGRLVNALLQGEGAGTIADFVLEDGESRIANAFGTVSAPVVGDFIRWMQDDGTDTRLERRLKNVVEGRIVSLFANPVMEYLGKPLAEATFRQIGALKALKQTEITDGGVDGALANLAQTTQELKQITDKADLIQNVEEIYQKSIKEGIDGTQVIHDTFSNDVVPEALDLYRLYQQGEKPFLHHDGTWDIRVTNSWTDAYKVSPEEYQKQLLESDSSGLLGIQHQDQAIRDTWVKRGWLGSDAELTKENARSIAKEYQNKWGLAKAPKIEFLDGNGAIQKSVDGTTTASGVIKIDKNAANPYATLRAELEHYRDRMTNSVPKKAHIEGSGEHFSRYVGDNEKDVAPFYTHKKATGRYKALNEIEEPTPINPIEGEQLKLEFNSAVNMKESTEELRNSVLSGEIKVTTEEEMETVLQKAIELDPEISKLTKADADLDVEFQAKLQQGAYKDAFLRNDPEELAAIYKREKVVASTINDAFEQIKAMDEPTEMFDKLLDMIEKYGLYIGEVAHLSGVGLQQHKYIKDLLTQSWGSKRVYDSLKEGLESFSKLLDEEFEQFNLNFTIGDIQDPKDIKQYIINRLFTQKDENINDILLDENFMEVFSKQVDDMFRNKTPFNSTAFKTEMLNALQKQAKEDMLHALKLAPNAEAAAKAISGAKIKNGRLEAYYINNLLSSPRTPVISWISGALNSLYFPARKYIQGLDVGGFIQDKALGWLPNYNKVYSPNTVLASEGLNTYKGLMMHWGESWSLAKDAFLNGDGKFVSMKKDATQLEEGVKGFDMKAWNDPNASMTDRITNVIYSMCRALGASDEQLSQLNYRAITRAKALEITNKLADEYGITDEALKQKIYQKRFDAGFTKDGKPTDIKTYYEVREMLYQTELDGSIKLPDSDTKQFVREQTNVMKAGKALQDISNKNTYFKMLLPFVRTGANIVNMALEHNHLYSMLSSSQRKLLFSNTTEGAKARSQVMFGYLSLAFASMLAAGGLITGSAPANAKEREALYKAGWQPYSFKFGDRYYSYSGIEPLHGMFGFAADWANLCTSVQNKDDETTLPQFFLQSSGIVAANFLEKAAFRNAIDFMSIVLAPTSQSTEQVMRFLGQKAQGLLPASAAVRGTVGSLGKTSKRKQDTFTEGLLTKYFNRGLGEYRRDAFGDRIDMFGALISNVTWTGKEPEEVELARLAEQGWSPSDISNVIANGGKLKLADFKMPDTNQNGYDLLQELLSTSGLREAVRALVQSEEYLAIADDGIDNRATAQNNTKYTDSSYTKVNRLKKEWAVYGSDAKADLYSQYGDVLVNKEGETLNQYKLRVERTTQAAKHMPLSQINEVF